MNMLAFLQNINGPEILLIFLVVLLLFGAKRLPELFRSFGKSIREFKKATSEIEGDIRSAMDEDPAKAEPTPSPNQVESGAKLDAASVKPTEPAEPEKRTESP